MKQDKQIPSKQIYHVPKFRLYGNIRELTQTVGKSGAMDGSGPFGPKADNKTSV